MRILWVKVGGLWPLDTGGRLRSFHIISELSRLHSLTLLTTQNLLADCDALRIQLPRCERIAGFPHRVPKAGSFRFARALVRSWLSPLPVDIRKWRLPALRRETKRLMATGAVDLCVADFLCSVPNVPLDGPVPVLLFEHNVEHRIWKRMARLEPRPWRRALLELEWRKMRRFEAQVSRAARRTVAVSDVDGQALAADAPGAQLRVVPTGVDTTYFMPNGAPEAPARLVFTGSMDWYPNEDGILYFIGSILPLIRSEVPEASLTVVGRRPSERLRSAAGAAGIEVTGRVEDVRPYIAEGAVYVVPLRVGGGTRLKIFEALAMGKAVVSTTVGAEGLPLVPGEHILQTDDPASFAQAVVSLLRDPARRRGLGSAGRRLVVGRYSWATVAHEFEAVCREVVEDHAG